MDNESTLDDLLYHVKKLDQRLIYVQILLDDNRVDEAKKILREITGS